MLGREIFLGFFPGRHNLLVPKENLCFQSEALAFGEVILLGYIVLSYSMPCFQCHSVMLVKTL